MPPFVDFRVQPPVAATPTPAPPTVTPTPTPEPRSALTSVTVAKTVSLKSVRKSGTLRFSVRTPAGARVTASAKLGTKSLGSGKRTASGSLVLKLDKKKLKSARKGATITLRVEASGAGLATTTHTAKIKLK